jgi:dinuclear metal center YbgI/SA1388 family protein
VRVAGRDEIVAYANALLEVDRWPEFAPPGLQVVGSDEVDMLVCGVSGSRELFERAADAGANMVLVHHGLFWRNEPLVIDRRQRGRLEALFRTDASLVAYHLALDAHATLGNAAQLAERIGALVEGPFGDFGLACGLDGITIAELSGRVAVALDREPLIFARGPERIERIAVSTGGGGYDLIQAAHAGFDALLTGEPELASLATARELGIHLIAAGHHATERFGVQALAAHLAETFDLEWSYLEVANPV